MVVRRWWKGQEMCRRFRASTANFVSTRGSVGSIYNSRRSTIYVFVPICFCSIWSVGLTNADKTNNIGLLASI